MAIIQGAITILLFIFILCALVVIHEFGHFVLARFFGIRVHEFGIGFPPRAKVMRDRGETIYTLNWLPIGGFVRLEGEDGDSDDPRSFAVAGLPKKLLVLLAGVGMNLLLAFVIFTGIAWLATPQGGIIFNEVVAGSPADLSGLRAGETILAIDGTTFDLLPSPDAGQHAIAALRDRAGQTVTLHVRAADGAERDVTVTLRPPDVAADKGALGIRSAGLAFSGAYAGRDPLAAVGAGAAWTVSAFRLIIDGLASLVSSIASNPTQAPPSPGRSGSPSRSATSSGSSARSSRSTLPACSRRTSPSSTSCPSRPWTAAASSFSSSSPSSRAAGRSCAGRACAARASRSRPPSRWSA